MLAAVLASGTITAAASEPPFSCGKKCKAKREYRKARKHTPRHPIPLYIVMCESGGQLHRPASDGLGGGRYQVIPSTWRSALPNRRFIRAAGGDKGPIWSSRLLQDRVALKIRKRDGLSAWVCS